MSDNHCDHRDCPTHTCVLDGLWWSDEEFSATAANQIWQDYIKRKHDFQQYTHDTAIALGRILRITL